MSILHHLKQQPFIVATGTAALLHSGWTLGTLFSGPQPAVESITSIIGLIHFLGWIVPAFLIAFSLDIGQIATSHEIRLHGLTPMRGITFGVFALATYYLQWVYMVNHMPNLTLSAGIAETHRQAAQTMSDLALWLLPALLPLSTLLYTFSGQETTQQAQPVVTVTPVASTQPALPAIQADTRTSNQEDTRTNSQEQVAQQIEHANSNGNGHAHEESEGVTVNPTQALLQNGAQVSKRSKN